jgi:hypothetical protein
MARKTADRKTGKAEVPEPTVYDWRFAPTRNWRVVVAQTLGDGTDPDDIMLGPGSRVTVSDLPPVFSAAFRLRHADKDRYLSVEVEAAKEGEALAMSEITIRAGRDHPPGGVVTNDLRLVHLHKLSREMLSMIRAGESSTGAKDAKTWLSPPREWVKQLAVRPGRRGHSDFDYALTAAQYVERLGSKTPLADLAKHLDVSQSQARSMLGKARHLGLLTEPPVRGRAGGELTAKAIEILRTHEKRSADE